MVNIGTLSAFILVSLAVPGPAQAPPRPQARVHGAGQPVHARGSSAADVLLPDPQPQVETWIRFVIWMLVGFVIYFFYSRKNSRLETGDTFGADASGLPKVLDER